MKKLVNFLIRWQIYITAGIIISSATLSVLLTVFFNGGTINGVSFIPFIAAEIFYGIKWFLEGISTIEEEP